MTVLVMLSPPEKGGVIAQAMAIQAHRPSTVILIRVSLGRKVVEYDGVGLLNAWVQGSKELEEMFPDLDKPYPFPVTLPKGYISTDETIPDIIIIDVEEDMIAEKLASLTDTYTRDEIRFDYLPGGKFLKLPLIVDDRFKDWEVSYTLETGNYILFEENGHSIQTGHPLSIVDRCWVAGFPVHVEKTWPVTQEWNEFYSGIMTCLRVEPYTEERRAIDEGNPKKKRFIPYREKNRPIGFNCSETLEQLEKSGYEVIDRRPEQITISKSGLKWDIVLLKDEIPAGNPLELLMVNILSLHWNPTDLIQGVSIIEPSAKMRLNKYQDLLVHLQTNYRDNADSLLGKKYQDKCNQLGFECSVSIEDLLNADMKKMNEDYENGTVVEPLIRIRVCEIDALLLDEHGISSFDAKAVAGIGWTQLSKICDAKARLSPPNPVLCNRLYKT